MIETPRAALRADEIAEVSDFFSFGTNDLTQMTFGFSRDDVESRMMPPTSSRACCKRNPFETIDHGRRGRAGARSAAERGRAVKPAAQARRVRRARRRPGVDRRSSTRSGSTTCRARRSGCRSPGWRPRRRSSGPGRRTPAEHGSAGLGRRAGRVAAPRGSSPQRGSSSGRPRWRPLPGPVTAAPVAGETFGWSP